MAEFVGFGMFAGIFLGIMWLVEKADKRREERRAERRRLEIERQTALFAGIEARWRRHLEASRRDLVA
jgi:predicted metalloprotease